MISPEPFAPLAVSIPYDAAPVVALDPDFNIRWNAWVARGRVHEQTVQRRLLVWAGALAVGTAVVYALLRA